MTKRKVTDLNAESNLLKRVLDSIKQESNCLQVSRLAFVIAILSLLINSVISVLAWNDAKEANIRSELLVKDITRLEAVMLEQTTLQKNSNALTNVYLQRNHVKMEALGIDPEPLPEIN